MTIKSISNIIVKFMTIQSISPIIVKLNNFDFLLCTVSVDSRKLNLLNFHTFNLEPEIKQL